MLDYVLYLDICSIYSVMSVVLQHSGCCVCYGSRCCCNLCECHLCSCILLLVLGMNECMNARCVKYADFYLVMPLCMYFQTILALKSSMHLWTKNLKNVEKINLGRYEISGMFAIGYIRILSMPL